jgi:hypothetical protein
MSDYSIDMPGFPFFMYRHNYPKYAETFLGYVILQFYWGECVAKWKVKSLKIAIQYWREG